MILEVKLAQESTDDHGTDRHILVSLNFGRSPIWEGAVQHSVLYDMEKVTPFGLIRAEEFVLFTEIAAIGQEAMDGKMFARLSSAIHREEHARYLEGGANTQFGRCAA